MSLWRERRLELAIVAVIVVLDQATKAVVRASLDLHQSVTVVPGLLNVTHVRNTGAAFGFLNTADFPLKPFVMAAVATLALLAIGYYALRVPPEERLGRFGLALVLVGAVGNLIDFYWRGWHFWAFNVADAAITIGAVALVLDMLGIGRHASHSV